jgi:hypothetical protein
MMLENLRTWKDNWDGCGSLKPKENSIVAAEKFIEASNEPPHRASSDENGNVMLDYWDKNYSRQMTFYFHDKEIHYQKTKRTPETIKFGIIGNGENIITLFDWLYNAN